MAEVFALFEDLKINVARTSRGTWSQITYTDGMQSNYTMSSVIDNENYWLPEFLM